MGVPHFRAAEPERVGVRGPAMGKRARKPVLLRNVVRRFDRVATQTIKEYHQSRSAVTAHLVYMRAAGRKDAARTESYFDPGWLGGHTLYPQWTARKCAATFLRRAAGSLATRAGDRLRAAAREYRAALRAAT